METHANPSMPALLRRITVVEAVALAFVGVVPFFFPGVGIDSWPWETTPFNIRFIGGVYLTSLTAVLVFLLSFRWAPGRVALPMIVVFGNLVTVLSFVYVGRFDFGRASSWTWFPLYFLLAIPATYYVLRYRRLPPAERTLPPPAWRAYSLGAAAILRIYGVGLLVAPGTFGDFWPWDFDAFHGRFYSAAFLTLAAAAFVVSRAAAPVELLLLGLTQVTFGLFSILGVVFADASQNTVDWGALGTLVWTGAFAVLLVTGLALVAQARAAAAQRRPSAQRS